jgi:hypothetical protein
LRSISDLIPLACEMARQTANEVHFALMGRHNVSIEGIQYVNGISVADCPMYWHGVFTSPPSQCSYADILVIDSRPSYAPWSTDSRMEKSVRIGLEYMANALNPHVVITRTTPREDSFFWKVVEAITYRANLPLISLPSAASDFMWLSKIDSAAFQGRVLSFKYRNVGLFD